MVRNEEEREMKWLVGIAVLATLFITCATTYILYEQEREEATAECELWHGTVVLNLGDPMWLCVPPHEVITL
jgi:hypothetical protein